MISAPPAARSKERFDKFVINPYVQMGPTGPVRGESPRVSVLWGAHDRETEFQVEWRNKGDVQWNACPSPSFRRVATESATPFRLYSTEISGINAGAAIQFRVLHNRRSQFDGSCIAPKTDSDQQSFAVFGDTGAGNLAQGAIARQVVKAKPDYAMITGDIVYQKGTVSEYLKNWFPIMNATDLGVISGAPLLSSVLCMAAPGNHDVLYSPNLDTYPDGLGYYTFWSQPLNGPSLPGATKNVPPLAGKKANRDAFHTASGDNFPRMSQYSFDYGNAHWTVLDANPYVDWTSPDLRAWLDKDLASAKKSQWRFVALHQSPFTSNWRHMREQQMRLCTDIFEKHKVDIVFSGHSHSYERSWPLRFSVTNPRAARRLPIGEVSGSWQLDKTFNGTSYTTPDGVIYIVTGAGGANLTLGRRLNVPFSVQPFTCKFVARPHSFTLCDIKGTKLRLRQISENGQELDAITIDKRIPFVQSSPTAD